ncbi:FixH family protein [Leptospira sp. 96542]|nr:FixH family protein [Leptospira sp. 96542]
MFQNLHPSLRNAMYMVLVSFIALVSATVYTIRLTYKHFEPVMDKNYYEIGLNYEKAIENQKTLMQEGYSIQSNWDQATIIPMGEHLIKVNIEKYGYAVATPKVTLTLERNATTSQTLKYDLKQDVGHFVANINLKEKGTWNTRIITEIAGKQFEKEGIIIVR